jgi:hypothetical protein
MYDTSIRQWYFQPSCKIIFLKIICCLIMPVVRNNKHLLSDVLYTRSWISRIWYCVANFVYTVLYIVYRFFCRTKNSRMCGVCFSTSSRALINPGLTQVAPWFLYSMAYLTTIPTMPLQKSKQYWVVNMKKYFRKHGLAGGGWKVWPAASDHVIIRPAPATAF